MLMLRKFIAVLVTAFFMISLSVQAAESPSVSEGFGCNFQDGKDFDDLDMVVDFYKKQRGKINSPEVNKMVSRVWTPFRGNAGFDFVWFNSNMTYTEWGRVVDAFDNTDVGRAVLERFNEVADCSVSGLAINELLVQTEKQFEDDGEVMVESYRCQLHPGKSVEDSDAALAAWKPAFEKVIEATGAASVVLRRIPVITGSNFDLSYLAVWDDGTSMADNNSAFLTDPGSAKSGSLFADTHRCQSALFKSRTVVAAPQ